MAITLQRAWNIATELNDKSNDLNRLLSRVIEAKIEDIDLTIEQRTAIRSKATAIAQEMRILLAEFLAV